MSFLGAVTSRVKTTVQNGVKQAEQTAASVRAQIQEAPRPGQASLCDAFEHVPRPKIDLCARADQATGLHVQLTAGGHRIAALGVSARGASLTNLGTTAGFTREGGVGVSTQVLGYKLGAHFVQSANEAMLGGFNLKYGGQEITVGLTPAAPMPLPVPNYVGPDRNDEEV